MSSLFLSLTWSLQEPADDGNVVHINLDILPPEPSVNTFLFYTSGLGGMSDG